MAAADNAKPTILLVTGSFALPEFYNPTLQALPSHVASTIQIPHLPTVGLGPDTGRPTPGPTMYDDAKFVVSHIQRLVVEEGKDMIICAHSYGGLPSTEALGIAKEAGLFKQDRQSKGEKGGVVRVGYLTVLIPEVGGNAAGMLGVVKEEDRMDFKVDEQGWMYHTNLEHTARVCASSMTPEARKPWFDRFPRHSAASFASELTKDGYKDLPVSYLVAEDDLCIPVALQRDTIAMIERVSGNKVDVTSAKTDHVLNVSAPQVLADWFVSLVDKH